MRVLRGIRVYPKETCGDRLFDNPFGNSQHTDYLVSSPSHALYGSLGMALARLTVGRELCFAEQGKGVISCSMVLS